LPSEVTRAITEARGNFAADVRAQGEDRRLAEAIVRDSLADSIRVVLLLAAALALAGAMCAATTLPPEPVGASRSRGLSGGARRKPEALPGR
jgi:hypothetical protein